MKTILTIFFVLFLSSCSKPNSNSPSVISDESNHIDFGELNVSVPNTGVMAGPQEMDFASIAFKQSGSQNLVITNSSPSFDLTYLASDFDATMLAPFTITSNSCLVVIKPRKKCSIAFSLSNSTSLQTEQNLTSLFKIKGVDLTLTGILAADPTDYSAPIVSVSVSPLELNFGTFKTGESKELSITVKNNGATSAPFSVTPISNPNITIASNSCPNPLLSRKTCVVKLKYIGQSAEVKMSEPLMKIANEQITYSGTVTSPSVLEPEVIQIQPAQSSISLSLNQPASQTGSIRYTNSGTIVLSAPVSAVSSDDGLEILSVSCVGGLQRSKVCDVNYKINSQLLPAGASTQSIRLQSGTTSSELFSINLDVIPNQSPCTLADAQTNGVNISNSNSAIVGIKIGDDISQCLFASNACDQYFSLSSNLKSCEPMTIACTSSDAAANLWNISQAATISGNRIGLDVSSCNVSSCNENYEITGKDCTPILCTQANSGIDNVLTVTGTKVSGCQVNTCLNEYEKIGNACSGISCNLVNAQSNGVSSILNVASVSGTINNDSCLVSTCNQYYKNASDNRSCLPKLCNELLPGELSFLGYNLTNATISGTYNSCSVSCNSSLQQLSVDAKSCEDKTPTGSIVFAQDYTKLLSGNVVNISQSNAQQIQFYSDAACTTASGAPLLMPLTQTSITILSGDGSKTAYAKLINGTAQSNCLSDSIILDTIIPNSFTITLPVNTTSSATAAPTVNFSSNLSTIDSGSGIYSVEYGIGTSIGNANVVSFFMIPNSSTTFLATVANGYLPPNTTFVTSTNYYTIIRVRDNAGNERIVSSAAWTYVPVVAYNGDIFAFSSTYSMVSNTTALAGLTAASFGADNYTLSPLKFLNTTYTSSGTTYDRIRHIQWNGAFGGRCGLGMLSVNGLGNTSMPMADTANASIKVYTKAECKDRAAILFRTNANLLREIKPIEAQEIYYFSIAP